MNILYNVTVSVDTEVSQQWLSWMEEVHIPDVLSTGLFMEAKLSRVLANDEGGITYAVQYLLESMDHYNRYQENHAGFLQEEHQRLFADKAVAFRTLLEVKASFAK
jgi:hypothetical protein